MPAVREYFLLSLSAGSPTPWLRICVLPADGRVVFPPVVCFVGSEYFAQVADIFFHIAIAGNENVAQPERTVVFFQPGGCTQCLFVASSCEQSVAFGVDLLDIEQYEVGQSEQRLHMLVPDTSVAVQADVDVLCLQRLEQWYQCFSLYGRFSTTEGNSSFFP